jgi:hypothetical protein
MTSESKILTVSYGTFSCTLEGFDNPFDTMKAIAEYFRDLAAQDRHFGAEPPPPDAAMLHRLAEREVARLAETRRDDAPQTEAPAEAGEGDAAAATPRIQFNPVARRPARNMAAPSLPAEEDTSAPEPSLHDVIPDGVAAKLARIRRAVHPVQADFAAPAADFAADGLVRDDDLTAVEPVADLAEADLSATDAAFDAAIGQSPDVAARLGELIAGDALPADLDLGEPLSAEDAAEAGPWSLGAEAWLDEKADEPLAEPTEAELPAAVDTLYAEDEIALAETDSAAEDLADLAALDGATFDEAALTAALEEPLPEEISADLTLAEAETADPLPEETLGADDLAEPAFMDGLDDEAPAPAGKPGRSRRLSSRVVRLRPGEDSGSTPRDPAATRVLSRQEETEEVARLMQQAEEVMAEEQNRRRQEALSRLKAAVVSTEADRADLDYEAPRADVSLDPYRDDLAEAIQPEEPAPPAPPPEVKPRRKSVSIRPQEPRPGTIRPGMISPPPLVLVSEQRIDRLAPAPTPATPTSAPSMAPDIPGIAPADDDGQPMVALRTGRLSGAIGAGAAAAYSAAPARNIVLEKPSYGPATEAEDDEDLAEDVREIDEDGFASFAETVGARSMAEMLEAAAAYATCVEKRAQFTRPQLMRRMMASAGGKPVSREDGLRSFGTLLRTGRIEKVTRGHYSLADTSPYLAEARRLS